MLGHCSLDRMCAQVKMDELRGDAQARRLSKRLLHERRAPMVARWVQGVRHVVSSILA